MVIESTFWAVIVRILAVLGGLTVALFITIRVLMRLGWDVIIEIYKK